MLSFLFFLILHDKLCPEVVDISLHKSIREGQTKLINFQYLSQDFDLYVLIPPEGQQTYCFIKKPINLDLVK